MYRLEESASPRNENPLGGRRRGERRRFSDLAKPGKEYLLVQTLTIPRKKPTSSHCPELRLLLLLLILLLLRPQGYTSFPPFSLFPLGCSAPIQVSMKLESL